jgi:hypothetical protein
MGFHDGKSRLSTVTRSNKAKKWAREDLVAIIDKRKEKKSASGPADSKAPHGEL